MRNPRPFFRIGLPFALLLVNLVVVGFACTGLKLLHERSIDDAEIRSQNLSLAVDLHLSNEINKIDLSLRTVVAELNRKTAPLDSEVERRMILALVQQQHALLDEAEGWSVTDAQGNIVVHDSEAGPAVFSVADRAYFADFKSAEAHGLTISRPLISRLTGRPIVIFARAFRDGTGQFAGIVAVPLPLAYINHALAQFEVGPRGTLTLRDAGLRLITRTVAGNELSPVAYGDTQVSGALRGLVAKQVHQATYHAVTPFDGIERIVSFRRLSNLPIYALVGIAKEDFLVHWWRTAWGVAGLLALTLLVINGGAVLLHRQARRQRENAVSLMNSNARLEHMAYFDQLTGLPNRARLSELMRQAVARCQGGGNGVLGVCCLDLDGFKEINDRSGHDVGDLLLIEFARRLQACIRADDVVARLGGDEFVVLFCGLADEDEARGAVARLILAAAEPYRFGAVRAQITTSVGVTLFPTDGADEPDVLLRQADQAMYEAKRDGKNRMHFFDSAGERRLREHRSKYDRLVQALAQGEFRLFYQPKVDLYSGQVDGVEALLRWQHPQRGLLQPGDFLEVIEASALTLPVGEWILHEALQQLERWQQQGLHLQVSVNVFAVHLQRADFAERLAAIVEAYPEIEPGRLELEILENTVLDDLNEITGRIQRCRKLGVVFSLDDFGTGYSSLAYLQQLPVSKLKIDRSFIRDMLGNPKDLALVEGIVAMAHRLGRKVVAEGVESAEHGAPLLRCGCDWVQGYGIARPMPPEELPGWLARWHMPACWLSTPAQSDGSTGLTSACRQA